MLGKLILVLLIVAAGYYVFGVLPQANQPATNPFQPTNAACTNKLGEIKQFAAQHKACQSSDDCIPFVLARDVAERDCEVLVDALVNVEYAEPLEGKAREFFRLGCGIPSEYCPTNQPSGSSPRCVANQCAWP